jgi:hypothetical protein
MSAFLNLALFVGVFYLILVYAGWPDRRKKGTADGSAAATDEKRIA